MLQRVLFHRLALLLLGLCLAGQAAAQEVPPAGAPMPPRPLELLLDHSTSLGLTMEQLDRLERIRGRLTASNEPLVERMLALRRQWQQNRRAAQRRGVPPDDTRLERIRSDAESLRARIQQNNRTAMQAVNRLLTRPQRAQLRAIVEERRKQDATRPAAGRDADAGGND